MYEIPVYPTESFEHAQKPNGHHRIKVRYQEKNGLSGISK